MRARESEKVSSVILPLSGVSDKLPLMVPSVRLVISASPWTQRSCESLKAALV